MAERYGGHLDQVGTPTAPAGSGTGLDGVDPREAIPEVLHGLEDAGIKVAGIAKLRVKGDWIELYVPLDHGVPVPPSDGAQPDGGMWLKATRANTDRGDIRWYVCIDVGDLANGMYVDTKTSSWTHDQIQSALDGRPDVPESYDDPGVRERLAEGQPVSLRDAARIAAGRIGVADGRVEPAVDVTAQHRRRLERIAAAAASEPARVADRVENDVAVGRLAAGAGVELLDVAIGAGAPAAEPALAEARRRIVEHAFEDTGHYDDGHSFGWREPPTPGPPVLTAEPAPAAPPADEAPAGSASFSYPGADLPLELRINQLRALVEELHQAYMSGPDAGGWYDWRHAKDWLEDAERQLAQDVLDATPLESETGHYDDGHGFGWRSNPPGDARWTTLTDGTEIDEWREQERARDEAARDRPVSSARPRIAVAAAVGLLAVLLAVVVVVSLGGDDGPPATADDAAAVGPTTTSASAATPTTVGEVAPPGRPVSYTANCTGNDCFTIDMATCVWTFDFDMTILDRPDLDGATAVIETPGIGLEPRYEVPVGPGGAVSFRPTVDMKPLGATEFSQCRGNGHFRALLTSVGGEATITPDPPP